MSFSMNIQRHQYSRIVPNEVGARCGIYTYNVTSRKSNLTQHVSFPTHQHGHILDLVITTKDTTLLPSITHSLISPSDHFPIFTSLSISPPTPPPLTEHFFRCIKSINMNKFIQTYIPLFSSHIHLTISMTLLIATIKHYLIF